MIWARRNKQHRTVSLQHATTVSATREYNVYDDKMAVVVGGGGTGGGGGSGGGSSSNSGVDAGFAVDSRVKPPYVHQYSGPTSAEPEQPNARQGARAMRECVRAYKHTTTRTRRACYGWLRAWDIAASPRVHVSECLCCQVLVKAPPCERPYDDPDTF